MLYRYSNVSLVLDDVPSLNDWNTADKRKTLSKQSTNQSIFDIYDHVVGFMCFVFSAMLIFNNFKPIILPCNMYKNQSERRINYWESH